MGYRAHVCRKYEVKYGEGYLNWKCYYLESLFSEFCPSFSSIGDSFVEMELSFEDLKNLIEKISLMSQEEFDSLVPNEVESKDMDKSYLLDALIDFYNQGDKSNEYVHIHWF